MHTMHTHAHAHINAHAHAHAHAHTHTHPHALPPYRSGAWGAEHTHIKTDKNGPKDRQTDKQKARLNERQTHTKLSEWPWRAV